MINTIAIKHEFLLINVTATGIMEFFVKCYFSFNPQPYSREYFWPVKQLLVYCWHTYAAGLRYNSLLHVFGILCFVILCFVKFIELNQFVLMIRQVGFYWSLVTSVPLTRDKDRLSQSFSKLGGNNYGLPYIIVFCLFVVVVVVVVVVVFFLPHLYNNLYICHTHRREPPRREHPYRGRHVVVLHPHHHLIIHS